MKIVIDYQGKTYESEDNNESSIDEVADLIQSVLNSGGHFELNLSSGGYLILGRDAIQTAAIMVLP